VKIGLTAENVSKPVLDAAVEAATAVTQAEYEQGNVPPMQAQIEQHGVRWAPEANPPGQESFDPPSVYLKRGTADCDDLAPAWAAELRFSGVDPDAKAEVYQSGPKRFHVVVRRGDGTVDDPSKWAGMGRVEGSGVPMRAPIGHSRLVVGFQHAPRGLVRARLDAQPAVSGDVGASVECIGYDTLDALDRATRAAAILAFWGAPDDVLARILACQSAIRTPAVSGESWEEYVGAIQASIDPAAASNIAMTLLDPFGLHNLIMPAAQSVMNAYAQQQAGIPPKGKVTLSAKTEGDEVGRRPKTKTTWSFNPFAHGVSGAQPGTPRGKGGRGGGGGRGAGGRGGGRGGSSRSAQQTDDQYWDDYSGFVFDQGTGLWFDPQTGAVVDPTSGMPVMAMTPMAQPQNLYGQVSYPQGGYNAAMWAEPYASTNYPGAYPQYGSPQGAPQYGYPPGFTPQQYAFYGNQAYYNPYSQ
jgi:hypothetical protein